MAILVPCLVALRSEFNALAPQRDKGADGWIGDAAHRQRSSDHNPDETGVTPYEDADNIDEVHALDIDSTGPWPTGRTFSRIIQTIVDGERDKWLSATDRCRLQNVIYNRTVWSLTWDFEPRLYNGDDPHTNHAHFSARYLTDTENDTRPWGVIPITNGDILMDFDAYIASVARAIPPQSDNVTSADIQNRKNLDKTVRYMTAVAKDAAGPVDTSKTIK